MKQPLSEVRISLVADQLILGKNRRRFTPEGQLFIDFAGGESAPVTPARKPSKNYFFRPWKMRTPDGCQRGPGEI